jgi:tRNA A37 threonylcarbamoyladenosine biosynthesis protein TsaE
LDNPEEIVDLVLKTIFPLKVSVIEWAESWLFWPEEHLNIRLKIMSETKRGLLFITGDYCELLRQFQKNAYVTTGS